VKQQNSAKTQFILGLILALAFVAFSGLAQAETSAPVKKSEQSKKHSSKKHKSKGKRAVVKKTAAKASKKSDNGSTAKLQTDINFNDSVLHGRYQTPDEATAKVENEKVLADLLAVRTNFKDRLKKASEQN
jgi:hypothetical protein